MRQNKLSPVQVQALLSFNDRLFLRVTLFNDTVNGTISGMTARALEGRGLVKRVSTNPIAVALTGNGRIAMLKHALETEIAYKTAPDIKKSSFRVYYPKP